MMKNFTISTFSTAAVSLFLMNLLTMDVLAKSVSTGSRRNFPQKSNYSNQDNFRVGDASSSKIIVEVRDDVELNCNIAHFSTISQYEWYKQNPNGIGKKRMTQFRGRYELSSQGQVKIRSLTHEDSGTYICKLASSDSSASYSIHLTVSGDESFKNNLLKPSGTRRGSAEEPYSEPQIIREQLPKNKVYHVAKGLPILLLKCESKGNPNPTITWYKDSEILQSTKGNISSLKLLNISKSDNAVYKCESVNLFGISVYEISLQVTDVWHGAAEIIEMTPRNLTILAGSSVNISCVARFETDPLFFWVKKVKSNKTENRKVFFHNGTSAYYEVLQNTIVRGRGEQIYSTDLIMTNVTKNDSGAYYCAVAGLQGFNTSETTLIVENDPSQLGIINPKTVAAQWAILWTSSFIILVILIVLCFVRIYGCQHKHSHPPKSDEKPVVRNTQLPESSPLTMSTHCTTHQCPESFVPLIVGSCSLSSSQDQYLGYESSNTSHHPYLHSHHHVSCVSSSNSTLLANLEAARSYCPNSRCSEYYFEPIHNYTCNGGISHGNNKSRRTHRIRHHHHRSKNNNATPQNNYHYDMNRHSQCELQNTHNLFSTDYEDYESNYNNEPKRKKLSRQDGDYPYRIDSHHNY